MGPGALEAWAAPHTLTAGKSGNWSDPTVWSGGDAGDYPGCDQNGDIVVIPLTYDITLDATAITALASYSLASITFTGTDSSLVVGASATINLTAATGIAVDCTNTSGAIQATAGTLTLAGGCSTVLLSCTAAGHGIVTSGTGAATLTNGTAAVVKNTSTGNAISHAVGTALSLTGNLVTGSTTAAIVVNHASATFTQTGTVSCATAAAHLGITFTSCNTAAITAPAGAGCILNTSGTSTAGLVSIAAGTLTCTGVGGATTAVSNAAAGTALLGSGNAALTITNTGANAIANSSTGKAVDWGSTGNLTVTGLTTVSGTGSGVTVTAAAVVSFTNTGGNAISATASSGTGVNLLSGTPTVTVNGDVLNSVSYTGNAVLQVSSGTCTLNGLPINGATSGSGRPVRSVQGTLIWTGARTLNAGSNYYITCSQGTLNLTDLVCVNNGNLAIVVCGTTITKTRASIVNVSAAAGAAILGDGQVSIIRQFSRRGN